MMRRGLILLNELVLATGLIVMVSGFARAQVYVTPERLGSIVQGVDKNSEQIQAIRDQTVQNAADLRAVRDRLGAAEGNALRVEARFDAAIKALNDKLDYALFGITISIFGHMLNGLSSWKRGKT